ncbi:MAG TPA: dipeptidyl aminopeptidase [Streptosporangiaceae bacterium]|nr:dipeptidyl aminopeptidase [Streptosporangiaceae bacterium]
MYRGVAMQALFKDDDFDFLAKIALGATYHRAADVGEVLSTVERIRDGHARSWVAEWTATADRLAAEADANATAGHAGTAARQYLRVSMYYSLADGAADGADGEADETPDGSLFAELWGRHRAAWDHFVDLTGQAAERIEIPYEDTTLPGYFFRSALPAGPADERRRTLIFNNGSDGPVTAAWVQGIADALARGWHAVTFDGPGQNAALVRQGIPFRPDWEHVITPVVDHLLTRPDVDPAKIALLGVSQGGYWVPRSVAFEHRIAAIVADPGVVEVSAAMFRHLPNHMIKLIEAGDRRRFDKEMALALKFAPAMRATLASRMRPYGTTSPYEFFTKAREYVLTDDVIARIACPVLVTDPDDEHFWPGQSRELYDRLAHAKTPVRTLIRFTAREGADTHCEPAGNALRGERIFDWLDERIPA